MASIRDVNVSGIPFWIKKLSYRVRSRLGCDSEWIPDSCILHVWQFYLACQTVAFDMSELHLSYSCIWNVIWHFVFASECWTVANFGASALRIWVGGWWLFMYWFYIVCLIHGTYVSSIEKRHLQNNVAPDRWKGLQFEICTFSKSLIDLLSMPVTTSTCWGERVVEWALVWCIGSSLVLNIFVTGDANWENWTPPLMHCKPCTLCIF